MQVERVYSNTIHGQNAGYCEINNAKSSAVAEISDRLATIDMAQTVGGCCAPFRGGSWVPI